MTTTGVCENCGAPWHENLACCEYCDVPIQGRVAGIRCPSCSEVATADARACPCCQQSFTKGCVFCGQAAFLTAGSCPRCHEAFEGAEERKAQRDHEARNQQIVGLATKGMSAIGQVAGSSGSRQVIGSLVDMIIKAGR
ncbi:MAG: hypothetical protein HYY06_32120 [Deltaproteobacteria bacterium]|nr:hypothetical protein [Deltaproteobacteria bacterium]